MSDLGLLLLMFRFFLFCLSQFSSLIKLMQSVWYSFNHIPHRHAHYANMECQCAHERPCLDFFPFQKQKKIQCTLIVNFCRFPFHIYQQLATTIGTFHFLKIIQFSAYKLQSNVPLLLISQSKNTTIHAFHFDLMWMQFAELWHWNWHCFFSVYT